MGFLKKIVEGLFGSGEGEVRDPDGIYLYVKCSRCGAPIRVRADKRHDLQRDYDSNEYVLRKEIMDGTCFSLIQATVRFDQTFRIVDREIEGGEFITYEEYRALTAPKEEPTSSSD
ncbi:MAG: hypothetical protein ACP5HS_14075 [Anaerolineae bacterium]